LGWKENRRGELKPELILLGFCLLVRLQPERQKPTKLSRIHDRLGLVLASSHAFRTAVSGAKIVPQFGKQIVKRFLHSISTPLTKQAASQVHPI